MGTTLEHVGGKLTSLEQEVIKASVSSDPRTAKIPFETIYRYLEAKAKTDWSWVANDAKIKRIIDMYRKGKIEVICRDLTGSLEDYCAHLKDRGERVSLVYLSNVTDTDEWTTGQERSFRNNINSLPLSEDSIFIETTSLFQRMTQPEGVPHDIYDLWGMYIRSKAHFDRFKPFLFKEREQIPFASPGDISKPPDALIEVESGMFVSCDIYSADRDGQKAVKTPT